MMRGFALALAAMTLVTGFAAPAAAAADFGAWLSDLKAEAAGQGVSEETLKVAFAGVEPIPRVLELDRRQPEGTITFARYLERVAPRQRVERGRRLLQENRALLDEIGRKYGVQPRFIVALWGIETDFGRNTGGFKVVDALATLAYDGRRSAFFRKELLAALQILDEDNIAPDRMLGSWAGAMGQSQFMPTSFLRFAEDHDGDGRRDIWTTRADVFASAANYLASVGWDPDRTWGREVTLPTGFDTAHAGLQTRKPLADWKSLGVRRTDGGPLPTAGIEASLVLPDGPTGRAFLVYDNYRTLLDWNRSTYFATTVGILADRIGSVD